MVEERKRGLEIRADVPDLRDREERVWRSMVFAPSLLFGVCPLKVRSSEEEEGGGGPND